MKTVFENSMVAHVWAQQEQEHGRSGNGNFYFRGTAIYSYRDGYPVGNFVRGVDDAEYVLLWSGRYSVTTSAHQRMASGAVSDKTCFSVPDLLCRDWHGGRTDDQRHAANVQSMVDSFESQIAGIQRLARSPNANDRFWIFDSVGLLYNKIQAYCRAFGVDRRTLPAIVRKFDMAALKNEYHATREATREKKEQKEQKLLERLGSQQAVDQHKERKSLLGRASCFANAGRGRWINNLRDDVYVSYDRRQQFVQIHSDLTDHLGEHPDDSTVRAHFDRYDPIAQSVAERAEQQRVERERQQRERAERERAERDAFDAKSEDEQNQAIDGNPDLARLVSEDRRITLWREGYDVSAPYGRTMMRVRNGQIETSRHARFPTDHATKAWRLLRLIYAKGVAWQRNGQEIRLGYFHIDRVTKDGTVYAGCHTVERQEVELMAAKLGLDPVGAPNGQESACA